MITSVIEMLELPNFGRMTPSTIYFESRDKILLLTSQTKIMTSKPLFQNTFISRRPRVADFAENIKIRTMFIKITLCIKMKSISAFLDITKVADLQ